MMLLASPPSSSSVTHAIATCINTFSERSDALPFGRSALKRLGGVEQVNEKGGVNAADALIIERYYHCCYFYYYYLTRQPIHGR
jgi:hypothetical protein